MKAKAGVLALLMGLSTAQVWAESSSDTAIEYRQGVYKAMEWNLSQMAASVQGRADFSTDDFTQRAQRLVLLSKIVAEGFADEQSARGEDVETRASYRIWQQPERFNEMMTDMQSRAQQLQEAAAKGEEADELRPLVGRLAQSCKACHDKFRD